MKLTESQLRQIIIEELFQLNEEVISKKDLRQIIYGFINTTTSPGVPDLYYFKAEDNLVAQFKNVMNYGSMGQLQKKVDRCVSFAERLVKKLNTSGLGQFKVAKNKTIVFPISKDWIGVDVKISGRKTSDLAQLQA